MLAASVKQELHVVAAGEAQIATAVLVRQVGEQADGVDAQQARRAGPHRVELLARFGDVAEHAGSEGLVVLPLSVVPLDDRRQELLVVRRSDIGDSFRFAVSCVSFASSLVSFFVLEEDVGVVARRRDHLRHRVEADRIQEVGHADALDQFADSLAVLAVLVPELPDALDQLLAASRAAPPRERTEPARTTAARPARWAPWSRSEWPRRAPCRAAAPWASR